MSSAQTIMSQGKIRIELNSPLKVFDGGVAVFARDGAKDEPSEEITPAQVLFVRARVLCCGLGKSHLLRGT